MLGTGLNLRVLKDTGRPTDTCARYGVADWEGYLAVAHTRMATESAVTVLHSHPFVPDAGPVRRAQRFVLELRHRPPAPRWPTGCSSTRTTTPRWRPATWPGAWPCGDDLEEATRWVMKEMDGFFTLVITTAERDVGGPRRLRLQAGGGGRDRPATSPWPPSTGPWPSCPASPTAIVFEPQPEEVYTWSR